MLHRKMSWMAFVDEAMLDFGAEQLVIVNGGLSTFAHNEEYLDKSIKSRFETNTKMKQTTKKKLLKKSGLPYKKVHLVVAKTATGENRRWLDELEAAGLNLNVSTLIVVNCDLSQWKAQVAEGLMDKFAQMLEENGEHKIAFTYRDEGQGLGRLWNGNHFGLPTGEAEKWAARKGIGCLIHERIERESMGFMLCSK